jgi:hypothetical protein
VLYASLALLGTNIGLTDLVQAGPVGELLGYASSVAQAPLSQTVVQLSGGTHLQVASAFAALGVSATAAKSGGALSPAAARLLSGGLAAAVLPVGLTLSHWSRGGGLQPLILFIVARLLVELTVAAAPLLSAPHASLDAALQRLRSWDGAGSSTALQLLSALKWSLLSASGVLLLSPDSCTHLLWNVTERHLPSQAAHLLPALAGAFLAAAGACAAVAETLTAGGGVGRVPALALCAGLGALGTTHAAVHVRSIAVHGYAAHAGVIVSALCVAAAAAAARELFTTNRALQN